MQSKIIEIINQLQNKETIPKDCSLNTILFKLPISYIDNKYPLHKCIKYDLELCNREKGTSSQSASLLLQSQKDNFQPQKIIGGEGVKSQTGCLSPSLYTYLFNPQSEYANKIIPMWSEYYTTDIDFLNDTKWLINKFKHIKSPNTTDVTENINKVTEILNETNEETGFYEKYKYIDIDLFKFLNKNPFFLQGLTLYNLTSPVISLLIPVLMLIIPFFLLKIKQLPITITTYFDILLTILKNHVVGKAITQFNDVGWDRRFFLLMSVGFYFINIYQNIISCYTFYNNIYKIRQYLLSINNFIVYSINSITNLNSYCKSSYSEFITMNETMKTNLYKFSKEITAIKLERISIRQITKIGEILRSFYQLFKNEIYKEAILYSLYLHGYIENICNLQNNIKNKYINYCNFTKRNTRFKEAYFAPLINENPVKNTYKLTKNIIITGPNAAGKTTILKTTLFNIILSQQLGIGFYKSALINPYKYIHSYINIPDTSERDSLFQAEARRCKEILDSISKSNILDRHFCIFDEIYSGTNPIEAIASASAFLKYISKIKNIDFMLTTHYISLCNIMNNNNNISNQQMECYDSKEQNLVYTYKLIKGISDIKGGIKVLEDLDYHKEIIFSAKETIQKII